MTILTEWKNELFFSWCALDSPIPTEEERSENEKSFQRKKVPRDGTMAVGAVEGEFFSVAGQRKRQE